MTQDRDRIRELIDGIRVAMLTTIDAEGRLVARPLTPQRQPQHRHRPLSRSRYPAPGVRRAC